MVTVKLACGKDIRAAAVTNGFSHPSKDYINYILQIYQLK